MNIEFEGVLLDIEVQHYREVEGDSRTWDSDMDYYGYTELEYEIKFASTCDEDGNDIILTDKQVDALIDDHADELDELVLLELRSETLH